MESAQRAGQLHRTGFPLRIPCFLRGSIYEGGPWAFRRVVLCDALHSSRPLPLVGGSLCVGTFTALRLSGTYFRQRAPDRLTLTGQQSAGAEAVYIPELPTAPTQALTGELTTGGTPPRRPGVGRKLKENPFQTGNSRY